MTDFIMVVFQVLTNLKLRATHTLYIIYISGAPLGAAPEYWKKPSRWSVAGATKANHVAGMKRKRRLRPCPSDFAETFLDGGWFAVELEYGSRWQVIKRWIEESGGADLKAKRKIRIAEQRAAHKTLTKTQRKNSRDIRTWA